MKFTQTPQSHRNTTKIPSSTESPHKHLNHRVTTKTPSELPHKHPQGHFTTSCSITLHHPTILLIKEITHEANSMKICLVTCIFFKLFSNVILLVTTPESLMKIYLLLKQLWQLVYFFCSISIINMFLIKGFFWKNCWVIYVNKSSFVFSTW